MFPSSCCHTGVWLSRLFPSVEHKRTCTSAENDNVYKYFTGHKAIRKKMACTIAKRIRGNKPNEPYYYAGPPTVPLSHIVVVKNPLGINMLFWHLCSDIHGIWVCYSFFLSLNKVMEGAYRYETVLWRMYISRILHMTSASYNYMLSLIAVCKTLLEYNHSEA